MPLWTSTQFYWPAQFAFTISFYIVFPALSIGLASFLVMVEWRWLATGDQRYRDIYKFWVKTFAVAFGIPAADEKEQFYRHSIEATVTKAATPKGETHV